MAKSKRGRILFFSSFLAELLNYDPNTMTKSRLAYKIFMIVFCTSGFVMQVWQFMEIYYQYPSITDRAFEYPDTIEMPALTFCNNNGFKRRKYCLYNEDKCIMLPRGKEVCETNEELCRNKTYMTQYLVPSPDFLEEEMNEYNTLENIVKYRHQAKDLFVSCNVSWAPDYNPCEPEKLGSFFSMGLFDVVTSCYTLNSRLLREETALTYIPVSTNEDHFVQVVLDAEPQEYFQPSRPVELMVEVHNPKKVFNSYTQCMKIFPGKAYSLSFTATEINSLPSPFPSNCMDYEAFDRENNETVRSQSFCISRCVSNLTRTMCACEILPEGMPKEWLNMKMPGCKRSSDSKACTNIANPIHCFSSCPRDCRITIYGYTVREEPFEDMPENPGYEDKNFTFDTVNFEEEELQGRFIFKEPINRPYFNLFNEDRYAKVIIRIKKKELTVFRQQPKFQTIEFFSYIGGYLGIWLGLSLIEVAALLELAVDQILNRIRKNNLNDRP